MGKERLRLKREKLAAEEAERKRLEEEEEERKRLEEEMNKKGKKGKAAADKKPVSPAKTTGKGSNVDILEDNNESDRGNTSENKTRKEKGTDNNPDIENFVRRSNSEIMAMVNEEITDKYKKYDRYLKDVQHVINYWHRE